MGGALFSGVSGLRAHQQMLDVAGNNLANVNTTAFKASRLSFSDLLSQTLRDAGQPTQQVGGTNPVQVGSGVQVAAIDRNMGQGSLDNTGQPLDMAIEGSGFFVLNDGSRDIYTRVGSFAVDSQYYLVDPATGYRVQRVGSEGVADGFQAPTNDDLRIRYDVALSAKPTETISYGGNLSADENSPTTQILTSGTQYTAGGAVVSEATVLANLDQAENLADGDEINISVTRRDGTTASGAMTIDADKTTMQDVLDEITTLLGSDGTATLVNGEIRVSDNEAGYSQLDLALAMDSGATGTLTLPHYFKILSAGGLAVRNTNSEVYDSQGVSHVLSGAFVRSAPNTWDMVLTSITGDAEITKRRIKDITFQADGSFGGLGGTTPDTPTFSMKFAHDPDNARVVQVNMGTVGEYGGLSQFGGESTAAPSGQDGYAVGYLTGLTTTREGVLMGVFTNGIRRELAALKVATFQNPAGLEAVGNNYFQASSNSGSAVPTRAMSGGAGAITGSSLERSNVEVASEFVNLIQAQNGYQANARTIRIANEMLQELSNLIR